MVVLLSSYNGARFIAEQISSIRAQTCPDWTLLVRDDGSSDATTAILCELAAAEPRLRLLGDGRGNLGPAQSFGALMQAALDDGAEYVALADQDDVWQPTKLERELGLLKAGEAEKGRAVPLLVHSDLSVVDEELHLVHPSFLEYQGLAPAGPPLASLLTQNFVSGCTTVFNRALLRAALPLPEVVMHDWWLALCAAALGELRYCPETTVLYRQHGRNAAGSRPPALARLEAALHPRDWWHDSGAGFSAAVAQAHALAERIARESAVLPPHADGAATVRAFCAAFTPETGALERLRIVRRNRIRPRSALGWPLLFYARVVLWPG